MNTLREAVQEYLAMRRSLGFKLQRVGPVLLDFVSFLEQHRASYITLRLALDWGQTILGRTTRYAGGTTLEFRAPLCTLSQRR